MSLENFIFGYGSLINKKSRSKTGKSYNEIPVVIKGIKRSWCDQIPELKITVLGAIEDKNSLCNGVIFKVSEKDLKNFDEREIGYKRIEIENENIISKNKLHGKVWIYLTENPQEPNKEYPLVQSYIDVVIDGCLSFGNQFTKQFINTTYGWNNFWINDRSSPRYPRFDKSINANQIDSVLKNLKQLKPK